MRLRAMFTSGDNNCARGLMQTRVVERNHDFVSELGGEPVTYGDGLVDRIRALAPGGVDAALDFVGGEAVDVSRQVLKSPERVASIVDVAAVEKGGHHVWVRPDPAGLTALAELADQGKLSVHIDRALPLAEAAEALRISRDGHARGKLVLTVGER
ncbi:hypothetical protein CLM62_16050 [Streptomyces sp. SA15]|nr:hypothetical protein CLM62_16050 [Streptomyces sp. SA15]